jgi:hypothetical protein
MLKTVDGVSSIPRPDSVPAWTFEFFTDAAGGSSNSIGLGSGGHGGPFWFYIPWGYRKNKLRRSQRGRETTQPETVRPRTGGAARLRQCWSAVLQEKASPRLGG